MNKIMLYSVVQAVGFGISTALAVEMERMPLFAVGRPGGMDGSGSRRSPHDIKKLLGRAAGVLFPVPADILGSYHRAAGRQGCKQHQNHRCDHIHKGNAGNSRLTHRGNHNAVRHAHQDRKALSITRGMISLMSR